MKKTLSLILALIMILSAASIAMFTVSAEDVVVYETYNEASTDEATVDEPKLQLTPLESAADGTVIGLMGDVNDDKKINIKDSSEIQKYLAKYICLNEKFKALSDVDNNQKINIKDATTLQKHIAKLDIPCVAGYTLYETGTHIHRYEEVVIEPKCEDYGYTLLSCICGEERKENLVENKGHVYVQTFVKPTCAEQGYTLHSCKYCNASYKDNFVPKTDDHKYNKKNVCTVCSANKSKFNIVKDFVIAKGKYDKKTSCYYMYLDTGYDVDSGMLIYDATNECLSIGYVINIEEVITTAEVIIVDDSAYFSTFVDYPGYFYSTSTDSVKYTWRMHSDELENFKRYFYNEQYEIPVDECEAFSIMMIDAALVTYQHNEDILPVTLTDLGFSLFEYL